jgi:hypothetical protein
VEITAYTGGTLTLAAAPGAAGLGALGGAPLLFSVTDTYALYRQESPPGYVAGLLLRRQGDVLVLNDFQLAQAQGEAGGYEGVLRRTRETGAAALSQDCL